MSRIWRKLLIFLEIIGLREERKVEQDAQLARFRLYHAEFRKLLSANNSFLGNMAELERKLLSRRFNDISFLKRKVVRMVGDIHHMVESISVISDSRFNSLNPVYENITKQLIEYIDDIKPSPLDEKLVIDMSDLSAGLSNQAGGKMANLGEVRNAVGLPTPDGFVVTSHAYGILFENNDIAAMVEKEHCAFLSPEDASDIAESLRKKILGIEMPPQLIEAILDAYDRLAAKCGAPPKLAVRSSALGEDSEFSFAGQFLSLLNVDRGGLIESYLQVVASLYCLEAIHYRCLHNLSGQAASMSVGCIAMIDAVASGIIFSNDPTDPDPGRVVIHAVRGLGVTLADGSSHPEEIFVSRDRDYRLLSRTPATQAHQLLCSDGSGTVEKNVEASAADKSIITDDEAGKLAQWAMKLEEHFGGPQDIEWAMSADRNPIVLQSRPLRIEGAAARAEKSVDGYKLLVASGETASPGVGFGPAVFMSDDGDFDAFPTGGVLVAKRSSPKFIRIMSKARAIVTDAGSTTGHMASLAREFRIPTLLNTKTATKSIPNGEMITVDATNGFVYSGQVSEIIKKDRPVEVASHGADRNRDLSLPAPIEKVINLIVPLNLSNPRSPNFTAEKCSTLHDMARFIHEKSYEQMFHLSSSLGDFRSASYQLDVFLPIDLYIIDLGGGIIPPDHGLKVKRKHITSVPFAALIKGMMHDKIPRFGPRSFDVGGFFSLMMRHATTNPEGESTFRDPSYAMVSDVYLNYTARVGYHFGVVDSYCGKTSNKNYISILFRGGAADVHRRSRRAWAISSILKELGFSVELNRDLVNARVNKTTTEETVEKLDMIGRLMQFMRQMDLAMTSDQFASKVVTAFFNEDYELKNI